MSEMIERVAKAILAKRLEHQGGRFATHPEQDSELARAAIEAMREPTPEMIASYDGPRGEAEYGLDKYHPDFVRAAWGAMIDAALKEPA